MRNSFRLNSCINASLLLGALAAAAGVPAHAASSNGSVTPVSAPQIQLTLEPMMPNGQVRVYPADNGTGVTYWTSKSMIYKGDSVHLDVFVATGANDLQELKVRLDNNLVADTTSYPWSATFPTASLTPGWHHLETWAQVTGDKTPQYVDRTLSFLVSADAQPQAYAVAPVPSSLARTEITNVAGSKQILNTNGTIGNEPVEGDNANASATIPAPPAIFANKTEVSDAVVHIAPETATGAPMTLPADHILQVNQPVIMSVTAPTGSKAVRYVYAIAEDGQYLVPPTDVRGVGRTNVRLQPQTSTMQGLIDGGSTFWVWGIDRQGNYSAPQSLQFNVQSESGS